MVTKVAGAERARPKIAKIRDPSWLSSSRPLPACPWCAADREAPRPLAPRRRKEQMSDQLDRPSHSLPWRGASRTRGRSTSSQPMQCSVWRSQVSSRTTRVRRISSPQAMHRIARALLKPSTRIELRACSSRQDGLRKRADTCGCAATLETPDDVVGAADRMPARQISNRRRLDLEQFSRDKRRPISRTRAAAPCLG